ncbi:RNA polymerase sigma factor [Flagellimonas flava]|uniref:RNA polymerase sigma factor, sigma-70 family n=1 Tax=Flagellimonas flava TaxID=570519 RepID=A0A1M5IQW7_9FLAO|nr:RNA polymerase sigma factor [Allomuricauda flava]SHG30728.1 RNA polymerase sigma factor, sigma-70 family [Allomuricauda flava]
MSIKKIKVSPNIKNLDDIGLLERICSKDDDEAYNEFVDRYYDSVLEQCIIKCKSRNVDLHVGKQIAHEIFERIRKYKSFDKTKLNTQNRRKAILGWLYKFLVRLFYDYHNSQKKEEVQVNSYFDDLVAEAKNIDPEALASKRDLAKDILGKLNKKEKEVVITDLEYKRGQKYLPDDVNESLAERLGVKKDTIRKIRERAIKKIKLALDEINQ